MKRILFLCVANSARSQMAEGIARKLAPDGVEVYSAGSRPSRVNPLAIRALAEIGVDASAHWSKGVDAVPVDTIDTVVTLCAEEVCPVFPRPVRRLEWKLTDPASADGSDEERLQRFRDVRDELHRRIEALFRA
jgi:arsenate reductase